MEEFEKLLDIVKRKSLIDESSEWPSNSKNYLVELKSEIDEVAEELANNRDCYLEDELGDVLWDYLNLLVSLEKERGLKTQNILARACKKYEQRVSGVETGEQWKDVKERQKKALALEQGD